MKYRLKYNKIYLVATRESRSSSHRVTPRVGIERPKTVQFSGNYPLETVDEGTYGTLVLTEELWQEWFSGMEMMPGFETAAKAANTLVQKNTSIYYGCPLCAYRGKNKKDADVHIAAHLEKWEEQFVIEEVTNGKD